MLYVNASTCKSMLNQYDSYKIWVFDSFEILKNVDHQLQWNEFHKSFKSKQGRPYIIIRIKKKFIFEQDIGTCSASYEEQNHWKRRTRLTKWTTVDMIAVKL